jgi:hypothetical protein
MRKKTMSIVKRAGLTFLAAQGLKAAMLAGATRWAGRKLSTRRNRVLRLGGQALTTAAAVIPVASAIRRRRFV